jgi:DNA polymerase (family 10)
MKLSRSPHCIVPSNWDAITDHSRRVAMAHGLNPERLCKQRREIERIGKNLSDITLLHGIEVDIFEDGSLDLPDATLSELDWVIDSVHYKLEQSPAEMTNLKFPPIFDQIPQ